LINARIEKGAKLGVSQESKTGAKTRFQGAGLALVPVFVSALLALLLLPRESVPDEIPIPTWDARAIHALESSERELATDHAALPSDVRELGSELRAYRLAVAQERDNSELSALKDALLVKRDTFFANHRSDGTALLRRLYASQLQQFLGEVSRSPGSFEGSRELKELAGNLIRHWRDAGWIRGAEVLPNAAERRVLYRIMWATDLGLEERREFQLSNDEKLVHFGLLLRLPYVPTRERLRLLETSRRVGEKEGCMQIAYESNVARERFRRSKIAQVATLDPRYPREFALGISSYRLGEYTAAAGHFQSWLQANPDGPYARLASNYLKRSLRAQNAL
jgi:hypothetical protein